MRAAIPNSKFGLVLIFFSFTALLTIASPATARFAPTIRSGATVIHVTSIPSVVRFGLPRRSPSGPPYVGTVSTAGGIFTGIGAIDYDADIDQFIVAENGLYGTQLTRSTAGGAQTVIASLGYVFDVAYDPLTRRIYVGQGCQVDAIAPMTGTITVLAGSQTCGTQDGQGAAAQFQSPTGLAIDTSGQTVYVADADRIRAVTTAGVVSTITSPGSIGGGSFQCAFDRHYQGLAYDSANGNLYVADQCPNLIRQVSISSGSVTTLAGQCVQDQFGNCRLLQRDGFGKRALFAYPSAIAYSANDGRLYVADAANQQIREVWPSGQVATLAGSGHPELVDGIGAAAGFDDPSGLTVLPNGLIYVADTSNGVVRRVVSQGPSAPPPPHRVALFDPPVLGATPYGITMSPDGSIWYSMDTATGGELARIDTAGHSTTYPLPAGNFPMDVAADPAGDIWFSAEQGDPPYEYTESIGVRTTLGGVTMYPIPSSSTIDNIVVGPDGNVWFSMPGSGALGSVSHGGVVTEYAVDAPQDVGGGFDDDVWTTGQGFVEDFSTSGELIKKYAYAVTGGPIARGPLSRMWFGQAQAIGEVLRDDIALFALPPAPSQSGGWNPMGLATASDGSLWFTANNVGDICDLTTNGLFTAVEVPAPRSAPLRMVTASDGSIWFTDPGALKIGRWF